MNQLDKTNNYVYNTYKYLPNVPQNCCYKMMNDNEMIWKILKYTTSDAWRKPDLTFEEKQAMIYPGSPEQEQDYNIFFDTIQDDVFVKEMSMIRVLNYEIIPDRSVYGDILIGFEVFSHYKINTLDNMTTRVDVLVQQIIETFNGQFVEGAGTLCFDRKRSARCRAFESGLKPYKGKVILMATNSLG